LYFLDFFNNGKLDGTFNVYLIQNNNLFTQIGVNKGRSVRGPDRGERENEPHVSRYQKIIVQKNKIKPLARM